MNKIYLTILCSFLLNGIIAQNFLEGNVYFMNSKYETGKVRAANNVQLRADGSNGDYSNSDGAYLLRFDHYPIGKVVNLHVGNTANVITDGAGEKLEWVNKSDIESVTIPSNSKEKPIDIIVCPKGYRDLAAQRYYKIIRTSSDAALVKKEKEYQDLLTKQSKNYTQIAKLSAELADLQNQTDSVAIYKEALRIASINKDNASDRVIRYLELLDEGQSIQEARKVLSIKEASLDLEKSTNLFKSAYEELEIRAEASKSIFDYADALICYDTLFQFASRMQLRPFKLAKLKQRSGHLNTKMENIEEAIKNLEYAALTFRSNEYHKLEAGHTLMFLGSAYARLYDYESEVECYLDASVLYENSVATLDSVFYKLYDDRSKWSNSTLSFLESSYNAVALSYVNLKNKELADKYIKKAENIYNRIEKEGENINLGASLRHMSYARVYEAIGEYDQAIDHYQTALEKHKYLTDEEDDTHSFLNNHIGMVYMKKNELDLSITYFVKALEINRKIYPNYNSNSLVFLSNIGKAHLLQNNNEEALKYLNKADSIGHTMSNYDRSISSIILGNTSTALGKLNRFSEALGYQLEAFDHLKSSPKKVNDSEWVIAYGNLFWVYQQLDSLDQAENYGKITIEYNNKLLPPDSHMLGFNNYNLGLIYAKKSDYNQSIEYFDRSHKIFEKTLPESHETMTQLNAEVKLVYYLRGLEFFKNKSYKEAILDFNQSISYYKDGIIYEYLGLSYYFDNQYENAIKAYEHSVIKDSTIIAKNYYNNIGMAFLKNEQFDLSKNAFSEYEKLLPDSGRVFRNWTAYYSMIGELDTAIEMLEKAIVLGYNDLNWLQNDQSINKLRKNKRFKELLLELEGRK